MRNPPVEPKDRRWDLNAPENQPIDGHWGIWIPETTIERHVTGIEMLNLPGEPFGDWRGHGVWLSRNFADDESRRLCVYLSEAKPLSVHSLLGGWGVADIRPRLKLARHPAAHRNVPVWGASHVRATLEWAWDMVGEVSRGEEPDGSEMVEWLSKWQAGELAHMADMLIEAYPDPDVGRDWLQWVRMSLKGSDRREKAVVGVQSTPVDLPPKRTFVIA